MNASAKFRPSRLRGYLDPPDGLTPAQALAAVERRLAEHRGVMLAAIDTALDEMDAAAKSADQSARERLFTLAYEVAGLAGFAGLAGLGRAARSLCDLIDRMKQARGWRDAAVAVHLQVMRMLRDPAGPRDQVMEEVLEGLASVATYADVVPDVEADPQ